eukprot:CAMPEP_0119107148 /NCGR_PEP_ID=MMETSP1180-20130426/8489_1 /TAXON_ID=3052 ORGANISM="Chlamydomonas cf sp, Strain CCMP681" /NCGR_SAMPLE_ID=MMETSP1180 /ASSEMBLY_ACC=CAM_ASM_000741 /LENGTH=137 /DNA_ID=CAMNT_0007092593 /DNA_START=83 /DNA_END=496 /DNA_ORIENTATION=+
MAHAGGLHMLANMQDYQEKRTALLAQPGQHYILFTADPDPTTGLAWCPDCVRSEPSVRAVTTRAGSLLECRVGPRTLWKSPDHPFRTDPSLHLTGIPTVLLVGSEGQELARLGPELEACKTPVEAEAVMVQFVLASQ